MHGVEVQYIPMKSYHTLFCPTYVLDASLQSDGGAGPPKWGWPSRIRIYLWNSPFHSGSMALVWNHTTGTVNDQYHVLFNDDVYTMPYMKSGTIPPNWEDLIKYSSEMATRKYVKFSGTWLNDPSAEGATDKLSDTFSVVTDHT